MVENLPVASCALRKNANTLSLAHSTLPRSRFFCSCLLCFCYTGLLAVLVLGSLLPQGLCTSVSSAWKLFPKYQHNSLLYFLQGPQMSPPQKGLPGPPFRVPSLPYPLPPPVPSPSAPRPSLSYKGYPAFFSFFFPPSPQDIFIDFRERGREGERGRESSCERDVDWLPLPHALTKD